MERAGFVDMIDSRDSDLLIDFDRMTKFFLAGDTLQASRKCGRVLDCHCSPCKTVSEEIWGAFGSSQLPSAMNATMACAASPNKITFPEAEAQFCGTAMFCIGHL